LIAYVRAYLLRVDNIKKMMGYIGHVSAFL
jgi:hypothetical protein